MVHSSMKTFAGRLLDGKDSTADSIIFGAMTALLGLTVFAGYDLIRLHHNFAPLEYGGGAAAILGGLGGGKALRDRNAPHPAQPDNPDG